MLVFSEGVVVLKEYVGKLIVFYVIVIEDR